MENKEAEKKGETQQLDHKQRLKEISNSIKQNNIQKTGTSEDEEWERRAEGIFEQIVA